MPEHEVGTQEEFDAAREALLAEEKELTRRSDALAERRRELPWVAVEEDYVFETRDGDEVARRSLRRPLPAARLPLHVRPGVRGRLHGLLVDHRHHRAERRPPRRPRRDHAAGLPSPAREAPGLQAADGLGHRVGLSRRHRLQSRPRLHQHGGGAAARSSRARSPPASGRWPSAPGPTSPGYVAEGPGLSAYALSDGTVYRTYVTTARGLEPAMAYYGLLDRTPAGRKRGRRRALLAAPPRRVLALGLPADGTGTTSVEWIPRSESSPS